jgi:hypothetical protein
MQFYRRLGFELLAENDRSATPALRLATLFFLRPDPGTTGRSAATWGHWATRRASTTSAS